jgi:PAS domain S-box-containing protein
MLDGISVEPDVVTWTAWLVLAAALADFLIQRKDFPFRFAGCLVLFAVVACGFVGLANGILPAGSGRPLVQAASAVSAITCWVAVTAVWRALPKALSLPNLSRMNELLQGEIRERQRANERSRLVVELAPYPIVMANQNGRIVQVNAQTEQCFGYPRTALIGQPVDLLVPRRLRDHRTRGLLSACASSRDPASRAVGELLGLREDGTEFPMEAGVQAIVTDRDVLVLIAFVDVTQQKNTELALKKLANDLQRSNSDLAQFAYVASHDLKEPLRKVSSFCQLLKERYQGQLDADAHRYIDYAVDGSRRMNSLITALLELAQVNSRAASNAPVDSAAACRSAIDNLSAAIDDSGAAVTCGQLPLVLGDEAQLTQLFQNLVGNAIKFRGPESPQVTINASQKDGEWLFSVRDNGIGIDPVQHHRVFQIFQRLHSREKYPGTGIGLAICQRIVERHGGRIWIDSAPECGTTFYFTLPPATSRLDEHPANEVACHAH